MLAESTFETVSRLRVGDVTGDGFFVRIYETIKANNAVILNLFPLNLFLTDSIGKQN